MGDAVHCCNEALQHTTHELPPAQWDVYTHYTMPLKKYRLMQVKVQNDWAEKTNKDPWMGKTNEMLVDPWCMAIMWASLPSPVLWCWGSH